MNAFLLAQSGEGSTSSSVENPAGLVVRAIRPDDAGLLEDFGAHLSATSRYQRFFSPRGFLPGEVRRLTAVDPSIEVALIASSHTAGREEMVGVARYVAVPDGTSCEMAIVIADAWQHQGLGRHLLERLIEEAGRHGIERMEGMVLVSNKGMQALAAKLGFRLSRIPHDSLVLRISKTLGALH